MGGRPPAAVRRARRSAPPALRDTGTHHTIPLMRPLAKVFLSIGVLISFGLAFAEPSSKVETVAGRIVAYSDGLMCLNGSAYWSILIHVENQSPDISPQFVEVRFSLPCDKSPEWLTRKSHLRKFRVKRDEEADSVLKEFMDCGPEPPSAGAPETCLNVPIWKRVPGAEPAKLPFGQRVPSYLSVDLPLVPVV